MRILFTGSSSFTGFWFIRELVNRGHDVVAVFQRTADSYSGTRGLRVEQLKSLCTCIFASPLGSTSFFQLIDRHAQCDLFCHHAADVTNYKSIDFDFLAALDNNTKNLRSVLEHLQGRGCQTILLTGTVFEQDEGQGSDVNAVYPYALSKGLTYQVFRYYAEKLRMRLGKYVIANPFGPYEELRFTSYLIQTWFKNQTPTVSGPSYVRDNIPVDLMARAYTAFAEQLYAEHLHPNKPKDSDFVYPHLHAFFRPSFYAENQGDFAKRFAREMTNRLSMPCPLHLLKQTEFPEPRIRINRDALHPQDYDWLESAFWDQLAHYYLHTYNSHCKSC